MLKNILIEICHKQPQNIEDVLESNSMVTFLNPYSYMVIRNKDKNLLDKFDFILIDGISLVLFIRMFLLKRVSRFSFDSTSVANMLFKKCVETQKKIFIVGSTDENIQMAVNIIKKEFPELNIIGYHHGYIKGNEDHVINLILESNPDYVISGMGTPFQEKFSIKLRSAGFNGGLYTCGGYFHQLNEGFNYYPKWVDSLQLRGWYRFFKESHVKRRVLIDYPMAIMLMIKDWFLIVKGK